MGCGGRNWAWSQIQQVEIGGWYIINEIKTGVGYEVVVRYLHLEKEETKSGFHGGLGECWLVLNPKQGRLKGP